MRRRKNGDEELRRLEREALYDPSKRHALTRARARRRLTPAQARNATIKALQARALAAGQKVMLHPRRNAWGEYVIRFYTRHGARMGSWVLWSTSHHDDLDDAIGTLEAEVKRLETPYRPTCNSCSAPVQPAERVCVACERAGVVGRWGGLAPRESERENPRESEPQQEYEVWLASQASRKIRVWAKSVMDAREVGAEKLRVPRFDVIARQLGGGPKLQHGYVDPPWWPNPPGDRGRRDVERELAQGGDRDLQALRAAFTKAVRADDRERAFQLADQIEALVGLYSPSGESTWGGGTSDFHGDREWWIMVFGSPYAAEAQARFREAHDVFWNEVVPKVQAMGRVRLSDDTTPYPVRLPWEDRHPRMGNPGDDELRRLERLAEQGDPEAVERLRQAQLRRGQLPEPEVTADARVIHTGNGQYFSGHRETPGVSQLLYASYGLGTTNDDVVEQLISEFNAGCGDDDEWLEAHPIAAQAGHRAPLARITEAQVRAALEDAVTGGGIHDLQDVFEELSPRDYAAADCEECGGTGELTAPDETGEVLCQCADGGSNEAELQVIVLLEAWGEEDER